MHNVSARLKNDFVLQARGFRWAFGLLSLVAMFPYIRFPQITHGKRIAVHIGNRNRALDGFKVSQLLFLGGLKSLPV